MKKAANAYRTIGEAAKLVGVATHVLRYWESQFPQLKPFRRPDGRRYYRPDDIRLAAGLAELLREEGLTTRGAAKLIAVDNGAALRIRGAARLPADFAVSEGADMPHTRKSPPPTPKKPTAKKPAAKKSAAGRRKPADPALAITRHDAAMPSLFPELDTKPGDGPADLTHAAPASGREMAATAPVPLLRISGLAEALIASPAALPADQLHAAATRLRAHLVEMGQPG